MNPPIRTENLAKKFRGVTALSGLDLEVPESSVYALVGPKRSRQDDHAKDTDEYFPGEFGSC